MSSTPSDGADTTAGPYAIDCDAIIRAHKRIARHVHRTPVMTNRSLDVRCGAEVHLKCELFQRTGSFKIRGALNAVLSLDDATASRGVVTHSSGNHAQALALAAKLRGIAAHVVMPVNSAAVKRDAVIAYGATVHDCAPTQEAREEGAARLVEETGGTLIPPFDHPAVMAGQGTMGLELMEQVGELDAIVVPVGGGGMLSGVATAVHALAPETRLIAAEPAAADDTYRSMVNGHRQRQPTTSTIADGLRTSVGELTWPIIRDRVERVVTVSEDAIIAAMRWMWERSKLPIEASAAVGVAALLSDEGRALELGRVGVILCGGNVDIDRLPWQTVLAG